jgi:hypothetical protein
LPDYGTGKRGAWNEVGGSLAFAIHLRRQNHSPPGARWRKLDALLPVGRPVTLALLTCPRCIWEINQVQLDQPPWSSSAQHYRCPGCRGRVEWNIHGLAWRSAASTNVARSVRMEVGSKV